MESFSTYTRQFLDPLEKPAADRIDGLPPAIAVTRADTTRSQRATVASATEIADYLRLVFGRIGHVHCPDCAVEVRAYSPERIAEQLAAEPPKRRAMIGYPLSLRPNASTQGGPDSTGPEQTGPDATNSQSTGSQSTGTQSTGGPSFAAIRQKLVEDGFVRAVIGDRVVDLTKGGELAELVGQPGGAGVSQAANASNASSAANASTASAELIVIVDRLLSGPRDTAATKRLIDSLETCQIRGAGCCVVFLEAGPASSLSEAAPQGPSHSGSAHSEAALPGPRNVGIQREIDGREWREMRFFNRLPTGRLPTLRGFWQFARNRLRPRDS
jgi:hypothetical protein